MKALLKKTFFGSGTVQKPIKHGLGKGIIMPISLDHKLQRLYGLDEREIQPAFRNFSRACGIFVDIGSSDGYYGLIYRKVNPDGYIFLFDSDQSFLEEQQKNFRLNGFGTEPVHFSSKFVADRTDQNSVALQDIIPGSDQKIFIKIDVDGGELQVLKGLKGVLLKNDCKLIVETHTKELEASCMDFLSQAGYHKQHIIDNAWWRIFIPERRPIPHNRWFSAEKG